MAFSRYAKEQMAAWVFSTGVPTAPTTWYLAAYATTADPTASPDEIVGVDGYARQVVAMYNISPDQWKNSADVLFTAIGATNISGYALCDSLVSGHPWIWWNLATVAYPAGSTVTLAANTIQVDLTVP